VLVNIREISERVVEVDSIEEAEKKWIDGEFMLNAKDFKDVEFTEYKSN